MRAAYVLIWVLVFGLAVAILPNGTASGQTLYITDSGEERIQRANMACSGVGEDLVTTGLIGPSGIALDIDARQMYWADVFSQKIQRASMDGDGAVEDVVALGLGQPAGVALDRTGGKVYWSDVDTNKIQRADLDGTNVEDVRHDVSTFSLAIDEVGGKLYWPDFVTQEIVRCNLDGTNVETVVSGVFSVGIAVDVDGGKGYWTEYLSGRVRRANLDGSGAVEDLVTSGVQGMHAIAIDASQGKLYWTNSMTHDIHYADLDGTNVELLSTPGVVSPLGLAIDPTSRVVRGDMNGDGLVNGADIQLFVEKLLFSPEGKAADRATSPQTPSHSTSRSSPPRG